jgi:hypothetical protein
MTKDKHAELFNECIYCGTYTEGTIRDIPVCRACAKELEGEPTMYLDTSTESAAMD